MSNANIESFLELYQSPKMKIQYRNALRVFFEWIKKSPEQIVEEYNKAENKNRFLKDYGILLSKYYNYHIGRKVKVNTALSYVTPVRAWFRVNADSLREVKIDKPMMAMGEHEYKLSQLQRMFRVANIREKAILSLGVCLGYGASMFCSLKRELLENIMKQRESEQPPIGFWYLRGKTKQPIRSHLTIEAMEALTDYWKVAVKSEWAFPSNNGSKHVTRESLNYTLKSLTQKAKIPTMGQIRWHLLRKFLFSALTNVSSEMNSKLMVGKSISTDVLTYLKNKTEQLKKEYGEAETFFTLSGMTNHNHSRMAELEAKVTQQDETLQKFLEIFTAYLQGEMSKKQALKKTQTIIEYREVSEEEEASIEEYMDKLDKQDKQNNT